ncbi:MAG: transposase, partial [Deltaproteobacteria bacterium]|nr:transposase [Deltaproteobacteria bacterium]
MPRQARLDAPGLLQHVMARGIERREIFKDDQDRKSFIDRLGIILEDTQTQCYAWALIPNHFHLLLRTSLTPLSKVMRRLMTGYAVTFNKRHKRSGHLFQNRYKSIVCEEDSYLLELIRYIHLNSLRAKSVKDLKELDKYPWTGHGAIMGKRRNPLIPCLSSKNRQEKPEKYLAEKTIEDVLLHFGDTVREARRRYRQFVKEGVDQGSRPELQGGGLVRSAGGDKRALLRRKREERELSDERILGSGDFVTTVLGKSHQADLKKCEKMPLELLSRK